MSFILPRPKTVGWLLFGRLVAPHRPPLSWRWVLLLGLAAFVLFAAVNLKRLEQKFPGSKIMTDTYRDHTRDSFEHALILKLCRKYPYIGNPRIVYTIANSSSFSDRIPLIKLAHQEIKDTANYCNRTSKFVVDGTGLLWFNYLLLSFLPFLSFNLLVKSSFVVLSIPFGILGIFLMRSNFGLVLSFSAIAYMNVLLKNYDVFYIEKYQIMHPAVLMMILLFSWSLSKYFQNQSHWKLCLFYLLCGLFASFIFATRASYLPIIISLLIFHFILRLRLHKISFRNSLLTAVIFISAFVLPQTLLVVPLGKNAYHPLIHSVYLGIANGDNAISKREAIEWNDIVGFNIVRREDKDIRIYSPQHENILLGVMQQMIIKNPIDMVETYQKKFRMNCSSCAFGGKYKSFAAVLLIFLFFGWRLLRRNSTKEQDQALYALFFLLAAVFLLLYAESTLVYSLYTDLFHLNLKIFSRLLYYMTMYLLLEFFLRHPTWGVGHWRSWPFWTFIQRTHNRLLSSPPSSA